MKFCFLIFFLASGWLSYGQNDSVACNYLPVARPDQPAVFSGDLSKLLGKVPSDLKKGTHSAIYKISVDCKGVVLKVYYQSGTIPESGQQYFADKLAATTWKPALDNGGNVTSFVFVTIDLVNGKISAKHQ